MLLVHLRERHRLAHAGDVHQNVNAVVPADDMGNHTFYLTVLAHVAQDGTHSTSCDFSFVSRLRHHRPINVAHYYLRAFESQAQGDRLADALSTSDDQRDAVTKPIGNEVGPILHG